MGGSRINVRAGSTENTYVPSTRYFREVSNNVTVCIPYVKKLLRLRLHCLVLPRLRNGLFEPTAAVCSRLSTASYPYLHLFPVTLVYTLMSSAVSQPHQMETPDSTSNIRTSTNYAVRTAGDVHRGRIFCAAVLQRQALHMCVRGRQRTAKVCSETMACRGNIYLKF